MKITDTPICLPKKSPNKIPSGTGDINEDNVIPSNETPALAKCEQWHYSKSNIRTNIVLYFS